MNLLLLLADFQNPSWHTIAWTIALIILLFCLPRLLGIVYIPHTHVGVIEKIPRLSSRWVGVAANSYRY